MIFQEKCFPCYILLTDRISLSDCLYFLRYWAICVQSNLYKTDTPQSGYLYKTDSKPQYGTFSWSNSYKEVSIKRTLHKADTFLRNGLKIPSLQTLCIADGVKKSQENDKNFIFYFCFTRNFSTIGNVQFSSPLH